MTKKEFITRLEQSLHELPYEECESALRYYDEYISDAGEDNEAETINNLGTPEKVATAILKDYFKNNENCAHNPGSTIQEGFTAIKVSVVNAGIELIKGKNFSIDYTNDEKSSTKINHKIVNNVLIVDEKKTGTFRFFTLNGSHQKTIRITVPECLLDRINIETVNGGIYVNDIRSETLHAETVNGGVKIERLVAEDSYFETVNGSISAGNVISKCMHVETVNGSLHVSGLLKGVIYLESVNGSIRVHTKAARDTYDFSLSTVSGSVYVGSEKMGKHYKTDYDRSNVIHGETVSGGIYIEFSV
ncbi:MAG: DUF4097 family beta strand repeat-containing protein [Clostridia bacterium]